MTPAERIAAAEAWLSKLPDAEHIHITRHPDGTLSADPMRNADQMPYPLVGEPTWVDCPTGGDQ